MKSCDVQSTLSQPSLTLWCSQSFCPSSVMVPESQDIDVPFVTEHPMVTYSVQFNKL